MGDIPVLIIGYQRFEMIAKIIAKALENTSGKIYISIDAPRSESDRPINVQLRGYLDNLSVIYPSRIRANFMVENVGCSAHVLWACDWFFLNEEYGLVLEDDCLPDSIAFNYLKDARAVYERDEKCLMISLSQFGPKELVRDKWSFSPYPLVWGWAASSKKWTRIRKLIRGEFEFSKLRVLKSIELFFWFSGARRAQRRYVDAWDTPLAFGLIVNEYYVLHPPGNFIQNSGNDAVAVHVGITDPWINFPVSEYRSNFEYPQFNPELVLWYRKNFYRIRSSHIFTNRLRALLDVLQNSRKVSRSSSQKYHPKL